MLAQRATQCRRRGGFTLIELIVVIAIIAILAALLSVGVMRWLAKGPELQDRNDITQMQTALDNFRAKFNVGYPPSRLFVSNLLKDYTTPPAGVDPQLARDSLDYLTAMFPRLDWASGIDWFNGRPPQGGQGAQRAVLEGDQCLVFFLGGMQTGASGSGGCRGWYKNPANPTKVPTNTTDRSEDWVQPFFNFQSHRLVFVTTIGTGLRLRSVRLYSYQTAHKNNLYAYFSSGRSTDGYNAYFDPNPKAANPDKRKSDCATLGVWPYAESNSPVMRYLNPNTYQIISAGTDGSYGVGTNLTLAAPYFWNVGTAGQIATLGRDDLSNFSGSILQAGP